MGRGSVSVGMLVFTFQQVAGYRSEACVSGVLIVTALSLSIQLHVVYVFITVDSSSSKVLPLTYCLFFSIRSIRVWGWLGRGPGDRGVLS